MLTEFPPEILSHVVSYLHYERLPLLSLRDVCQSTRNAVDDYVQRNNILNMAIMIGDVDMVRNIINKMNKNMIRLNSLILATEIATHQIWKMVYEAKDFGDRPFESAILGNRKRMMKRLLKMGMELTDRHIQLAFQEGHKKILEYILRYLDIEKRHVELAIESGNFEIVTDLMKACQKEFDKDDLKKYMRHAFRKTNNSEIVRYFGDKCVKVGIRPDFDDHMWVCRNRNPDIIFYVRGLMGSEMFWKALDKN